MHGHLYNTISLFLDLMHLTAWKRSSSATSHKNSYSVVSAHLALLLHIWSGGKPVPYLPSFSTWLSY